MHKVKPSKDNSKPPAQHLTPEQREELAKIQGKRARAQYLMRFLSQPAAPNLH